ncbi:MAG: alkaline phosphatase [Pirellulaceae bacterium]
MSRLLRTVVSALLLLVCGLPLRAGMPKNVILMIGDGMGFEQVKAANYLHGGPLPFEQYFKGAVTTDSSNSKDPLILDQATDSAAAATAMATGQKVNNEVLSVAAPGDGRDLRTLVEIFKGRNASTGLVTTTAMTNATPAAFAAHTASRTDYTGIAADYFTQTRPNVLFGGGGDGTSDTGMNVGAAAAAGYTVVSTLTGMASLKTSEVSLVSGQFGSGRMPYDLDPTYGDLPHLSQMTNVALDILDNDSDGFFLMVEGGLIDWAAHENSIEQTVNEVLEFSRSVDVVANWAASHPDTLILVTADHETGGLTVTNNGQGILPTAAWQETGHTSANVPFYAWGAGAELVDSYLVNGVMDNTDIFRIASVPEPATWVLFSVGLFAMWWGTTRRRRAHVTKVS